LRSEVIVETPIVDKFARKVNKTRLRAGGIAEVVECLLSSCESLSSNPTTIKKAKTES
jgi:hypothetical protein